MRCFFFFLEVQFVDTRIINMWSWYAGNVYFFTIYKIVICFTVGSPFGHSTQTIFTSKKTCGYITYPPHIGKNLNAFSLFGNIMG